MKIRKLLFFALIIMLLTACGSAPADDQLSVVATTSIVADVAAQVAGEHITVEALLPVGADPHGFDPSPQDIVKVSEADLVLANGAGLEEFLADLIESAEADEQMVVVSDGTDFIEAGEHDHDDDHAEDHDADADHDDDHAEDHDDDHAEDHDGHDHDHGAYDPHLWTDPNNVLIWVDNIEAAFAELDPAHAEEYAANAEAYRAELMALDAWVREQVAAIPEGRRVIVTDHTSFTYFADEYGFEQAGAIVPGYSTLAEPTAKELAELEDAIVALDVKAVFVGNTVNPALAERVSEDTGVHLVYLYTGSLSEPGGEADSYLDFIRYNVNAIVAALAAE